MALGIRRLLENSSVDTCFAAAKAASVAAASPRPQWNERFLGTLAWICGPSVAVERVATASSSSNSVSTASAPAFAASRVSPSTTP